MKDEFNQIFMSIELENKLDIIEWDIKQGENISFPISSPEELREYFDSL